MLYLCKVRLSPHMSQVAHQAGAYPGFCSMKRLGAFIHPLDGMLIHCRVNPSIRFAGTHLYTWVKRGTVRVKCLAQEHCTMTWPGQLNPEMSALTLRPPCLYLVIKGIHMLYLCTTDKLTSASKKSTSFLRKISVCFSNSF